MVRSTSLEISAVWWMPRPFVAGRSAAGRRWRSRSSSRISASLVTSAWVGAMSLTSLLAGASNGTRHLSCAQEVDWREVRWAERRGLCAGCAHGRVAKVDVSNVQEAAAALARAYATHEPIEPLIKTYPEAGGEDAYRIQQEQVRQWVEGGDAVRGHKVGLASAAMQRQMGVDQPDYGHLTGSMFHLEHQPIPTAAFLQPRIEPEIAFVLSTAQRSPGVTAADAVRAVDFVLPSLEIVDSRIRDWKISLFDTIADNASSGGVVLGSRPTALHDADLRLAGCVLHQNGAVAATGAGGAVLGSPLNSLVWLANTVGPLGVTLEPGHVVLPGSMTRAIPVSPGDALVATIAGLGSVFVVFAPASEDSWT